MHNKVHELYLSLPSLLLVACMADILQYTVLSIIFHTYLHCLNTAVHRIYSTVWESQLSPFFNIDYTVIINEIIFLSEILSTVHVYTTVSGRTSNSIILFIITVQ